MDIRNELGKRIEKGKQKILDLKIQIEREEAFIQGLNEALKMLPKEKTISSPQIVVLRDGSAVKKIYDLLQQSGKPLHIVDILTGIGKQNTKSNRLSIAGSLGRYVRNGNIFKRTGPNQFALIGMDSPKEDNEDVVDLPFDFGKEN